MGYRALRLGRDKEGTWEGVGEGGEGRGWGGGKGRGWSNHVMLENAHVGIWAFLLATL